jgi:hypothetical protein
MGEKKRNIKPEVLVVWFQEEGELLIRGVNTS